MPVSNALYLGFGPITYKKGKTEIKRYIAPGSKAEFLITFPKELSASMFRILQFIDSFGTIGSRSRNGWGSLAFSGNGFESKDIQSYETATISQLIDHGKGKQYPTRLGSDSRGILCWETNDPQNDWKLTMQSLAETYMKLRTQINIKPQGLRERHLLGYPVTNHPIPEWGGNEGRMPSQLRLMVKQNQKKQLVGRILHLPHKLPKQWNSMLGTNSHCGCTTQCIRCSTSAGMSFWLPT
jgi:CRISPR-associated protein Cmr1